MLEIIYNPALQKQPSLNRNHDYLNTFFSNNVYKSIFTELKKSFLKEEIEFNNVFTQEKKYDDKYFISPYFSVNTLIKILHEKDNSLNTKHTDTIKNNNIQKKNYEYIDFKLNNCKRLNNLQHYKIKKNKQKYKISKQQSNNDLLVKNQNQLNENIIFKKINTIKNWYTEKKIKFLYKNNLQFIKNSKNILFISGLKNIDNISYTAYKKNIFKNNYQPNNLKSRLNPLSMNHEDNSIKWKKEIHQRILLSISNKEHEAEIYLKPENIGSIYINIKIKKDEAVLNFTSDHGKIIILLDNYIPILRNSLIKNGVFLKKVNIYNNFFLKDKNYNSNKKLFSKHIFNSYSLKKIDVKKHKPIDIYV